MFLTWVLLARPWGLRAKTGPATLPRQTLTPLRFFLACICEGLGVDSGLAIWLQKKRKADFSALRDHLPDPG